MCRENLRHAVLVVPGYTGSGPGHWQSLWEQRHANIARVEQADWDRPDCDAWVARLNDAIRRARSPVLLVAHSLGCLTVVHWADRYDDPLVRGALLVAPADVEAPDVLPELAGFAPIPLCELPFPSTLVCSDDDPYLTRERARVFASAWGSRCVAIGAAGHVNTASGLGPWSRGWELLATLDREITAR